MASDVRVFISDAAIIQALNTPGGAVYEWRNDLADTIQRDVREHSPVNSPLNAKHRGGVVGTLKLGWFWTPVGSNQHIVRAVIWNSSDHAFYVEWGRNPAHGRQVFSWTKWKGETRIVNFTRGYPAKHLLRDATNRALVSNGLYPMA